MLRIENQIKSLIDPKINLGIRSATAKKLIINYYPLLNTQLKFKKKGNISNEKIKEIYNLITKENEASI